MHISVCIGLNNTYLTKETGAVPIGAAPVSFVKYVLAILFGSFVVFLVISSEFWLLCVVVKHIKRFSP